VEFGTSSIERRRHEDAPRVFAGSRRSREHGSGQEAELAAIIEEKFGKQHPVAKRPRLENR
jgi:hypothetical protein